MNYRIKLSTILFVGFAWSLLFLGINAHAGVRTYNQKRVALSGGTATYFVNNTNYSIVPKYSYGASNGYYESGTYQTQPYYMLATGGNFRRNAKTSYYLPVSYNSSGDMANPQSVAVSKSGQYAYVMYPGFSSGIVRYDLWKLNSLGVNTDNMAALRYGLKRRDPQIMAAVKFGPSLNVGHGQSLALNPKTNRLWFIRMDVVTRHPVFVEVSANTLAPIKEIKTTFSHSYSINNELAFDNNGNAYTYVKYRPLGKHAGRIVIFKGKISAKSVKFKAVRQGILNGPGVQTQGMGYNPAKNRLYLVSDGVVTSVPVSKLGHLKNRDVKTTRFGTNLEFEGIAFTSSGTGYIMTIRGAQLFTIENF